MTNQTFAVMIAGIAKAGMEDYIKHFFKDLTQKSQQDPGCIIYNIHQSKKNPAEFMMYSSWKDEAAFDAHNQTEHMSEFKAKLVDDLFEITSPKTLWTVIKE